MNPINIDLTNITKENSPVILSAIITKLNELDEKIDNTDVKLTEHDRCLEVLKFGTCKLFPWIARNKWIIVLVFIILSLYLSAINFSSEWASRWIQWAFYPPIGTCPTDLAKVAVGL
jgi:hypothetical protein